MLYLDDLVAIGHLVGQRQTFRGHPTHDLTAYDLYLRPSAMVLSSARQTPEALRLTEQAIARDPHYGPALAWAAFCCFRLLLTIGATIARRIV
jgi:hypothetical protein